MHGSFKKLSLPPRISDHLLGPLSGSDHEKYVNHYVRLEGLLGMLRRKGATAKAIIEFGFAADWFRTIDVLFRRWCAPWAFAYIHHTHPAGYWPGGSPVHVDALTFGMLWFLGFAGDELLRYQCQSGQASLRCVLCGRRFDRRLVVLRHGVPCCGCGKTILKPIQSTVIVSDDWSWPVIVDRFIARCREQRLIDLDSSDASPDLLVCFRGRRVGRVETLLRANLVRDVPTLLFMEREDAVVCAGGGGPIVGGVRVQAHDGELLRPGAGVESGTGG